MMRRNHLLLHKCILISNSFQPSSLLTNSLPFGLWLYFLPNFSDKCFALIIALMSSVRTLWIVLGKLCNYMDFLRSNLPHLFHQHIYKRDKRNLRYKTSVGNWHSGYWRTNDTILNFKMKEGY